jgi:hypothetical protein
MTRGTRKRDSGKRASQTKKPEKYYEQTIVQPAGRLIVAIRKKITVPKTVAR